MMLALRRRPWKDSKEGQQGEGGRRTFFGSTIKRARPVSILSVS